MQMSYELTAYLEASHLFAVYPTLANYEKLKQAAALWSSARYGETPVTVPVKEAKS